MPREMGSPLKREKHGKAWSTDIVIGSHRASDGCAGSEKRHQQISALRTVEADAMKHIVKERYVTKPKDDVFAAIHSAASDMFEIRLIDKQTMRNFDRCCLTTVPEMPDSAAISRAKKR